MSNLVATFYDQSPENEWNRLFLNPYRRLEYEVVLHFLDRYLPPNGHILDAGGGPGRYALALLRRGYSVTLLDVSPANIEFAKDKMRGSGYTQAAQDARTGDARDLSPYPNAAFDAVLCMGPLYHLPKTEDRLRCLRECRRVLKSGSPLLAMVIPRGTYIKDALRSGTFTETISRSPAVFEEIWNFGVSADSQMPQMYFCNVQDAREEIQAAGFDIAEMVSTQGMAAFLDEEINRIGRDANAWSHLLRLVLTTCTDPFALSSAEHMLLIARRR